MKGDNTSEWESFHLSSLSPLSHPSSSQRTIENISKNWVLSSDGSGWPLYSAPVKESKWYVNRFRA